MPRRETPLFVVLSTVAALNTSELGPAAMLFQGNLETLSDRSDFGFLEGGLWSHTGQFLLFSDLRWRNASGAATGMIWKYDQATGQVNEFLPNAGVVGPPSAQADDIAARKQGGPNGMIWGWRGDGDLLLCQHGHRRIVNFNVSDVTNGSIPAEKVTVVADMFNGRPLNSPNDMMLVAGKLYFTDPPFGLKYTNDTAGGMDSRKDQPDDGIYVLSGLGGNLTKLPVTVTKPNGIALSNGNVFIASTPPTKGFYMFSTAGMGPSSIGGPGSKLNMTPANGVTTGFFDGFATLGRYVLGAGVGGVYIFEGSTGTYKGFLASPGITNLHIGGGYLWLMRNAGPPRLFQRVKIDTGLFDGALVPAEELNPQRTNNTSKLSERVSASGACTTRFTGMRIWSFAGAVSLIFQAVF